MQKSVKVFLCIPTYREPAKVKLFLDSMNFVRYPSVEVVIVNANGPDDSSVIINDHLRFVNYKLTEIFGKSDEYWSASVNRGLKYIESISTDKDLVAIANIDIEFRTDIISALADRLSLIGNCQVGAVALSNRLAISSGVIVKSWGLTLNRHPFAGLSDARLPNNVVCPVHFLPGRCFIFPVRNLKISGLIDAKSLPHYCADYEFSYRLTKSGCPAYLDLDVRIAADMTNTGVSTYDTHNNILHRFSNLWSIKNPSNPYYRIIMVTKMFPFYWIPFGIILYLFRTFLEVILGGRLVNKILGGSERGYSGSDVLK